MQLKAMAPWWAAAAALAGGLGWALAGPAATADDAPAPAPAAKIDGVGGPGWRTLTGDDFRMVNGDPDTWTWKGDGVHCSGLPVGVTRSIKEYGNFELTARWRHLKSGGNSGFFLWVVDASLDGIKPGQLPRGGIEVQVLDHGYTEQYEKSTGKKADWFTTHGDVFSVGTSKITPFPPVARDGRRSFPTKNLGRGVGEWNHYYIRAINGEVRLWVNGEEVSGGTGATPSRGYLCLEAEGAPVDFEQIRIRELP